MRREISTKQQREREKKEIREEKGRGARGGKRKPPLGFMPPIPQAICLCLSFLFSCVFL